jgi:hypothetical protein
MIVARSKDSLEKGTPMAFALWDQGHDGIFVDNTDPAFFTACCNDLKLINSRPVGKALLELLSKRARGIGTTVGKRVDIEYTGDIGSVAQNSVNLSNGAPLEKRKAAPPGSVVNRPGRGDSSLVRYGHNLEATYTHEIGLYTPEFIALAHELVHALHVIGGDVVKEYSWATDGAIIEEARTVGIGPYANTRISENAVRKEWNLGRRTYYANPGDADGLPSTT